MAVVPSTEPCTADELAATDRQRPKAYAVDRSPRLRTVVEELLKGGWSPASIAGRLPRDYRDDQAVRVSHEAIYQWVYAQPVSTLARELIRLGPAAPSAARARVRPRHQGSGSPATSTSVPPRSKTGRCRATGRGDLVIGKAGKSAVATLVERTSRFVILVPLSGRDALTVGDAVIAAAGTLPPQGCRCTSPVRTRRGSGAATRTRTVSCASTSPKASRSPPIPHR
ncbi:IS30 family transposase [Micromonospora okii]|uniref:IS30 family transposase n=1 Tax=Micromonospora okii TaxID=1182970 RepID=UPI003571766C